MPPIYYGSCTSMELHPCNTAEDMQKAPYNALSITLSTSWSAGMAPLYYPQIVMEREER